LGTSTIAKAKEYFSNLDLHEIQFSNLSTDISNESNSDKDDDDDDNSTSMQLATSSKPTPDSPVSGSDLIVIAFSQKKAEERKQWLNKIEKGIFCNYTQTQDGGLEISF